MDSNSSKCTGSVPSKLVGRLIGKAGATVRELESRTSCRVRTAEQKLGQASDEAMTDIFIRSTAPGPDAAREAAEARCWRAAQLLLDERLSLEAALAQVDEECKEHERLEAARHEAEYFESLVRRVLASFPEFQAENVRAALRESCLDEDDAVDMLLAGYQAPSMHNPERQPTRERSAAENAARTADTKEREEFPLLLAGSVSANLPSGKPCGGRWCSGQPTRRPAITNLSSTDAFPELPAPCPRPAVRRCARPQQQTRRRA